jgi:hypothetical protein
MEGFSYFWFRLLLGRQFNKLEAKLIPYAILRRIVAVTVSGLAVVHVDKPALALETYGQWKIVVTNDPMTDDKVFSMTVNADGTNSLNAVTLSVSCSGLFGSIDIGWGHRYLATDNIYGKEITLRVDKSAPYTTSWPVLDDETTLTAPNIEGFINQIAGGEKLAVMVTPYQA